MEYSITMPDCYSSKRQKGFECRSKQFIEKIHRMTLENQMLKPGDAVLAGVSGGPDSVCLLHLLIALSRETAFKIGVAHLNHGLRASAADQDADFVRLLTNRFDLDFFYKKVDVQAAAETTGLSLEEAGRVHRYAFFNEISEAKGFTRIAVGHNSDDNAELFLMNLLRGSGPSGLKGMQPVSGNIIRPLIQTNRKTIMHCLAENQIPYRTDHTNTDSTFLRNRIRHELLPLLEQNYNPAIRSAINRMTEIFSSEQDWLNTLVDQSLLRAGGSFKQREQELSIAELKKLKPAHLRRLLRRVIETLKGDLRGITYYHIDAAARLVHNCRKTAWIDLPARIRLEKCDHYLRVRQESHNLRKSHPLPSTPVYRYTINFEDFPIHFPIPEIQGYLSLSRISRDQTPKFPNRAESREDYQHDQRTAYMDLDRILPPLTVRNPEPGDRLMPLGMKGSQKIKDYFINQKVPRQRRPFFPVLCSKNRLIWLAGHVVSEKVKITPASSHILKAEFKTEK